jgi:hypothetical protein
MGELEPLLDGKRTFPRFVFNRDGKGLNLKTLLDDPPEKFVLGDLISFPENLPDKYWSNQKDVNLDVLLRVFQIFGNPTTVGYAVWFN